MARKAAATALMLSLALVCVGADAATRDRVAPYVNYTTPDDAVRIWAPVHANGLNEVVGRASDWGTGVARVTVTFCTGWKVDGGWVCNPTGIGGQIEDGVVTLSCTAGNKTCTWTSSVPMRPGPYLALVRAYDRAGNARSPEDPIEILVV